MKKFLIFLIATGCILSGQVNAQKERPVWSKEKAETWYATKGWIRGSNFISSSAINQLEMWQKETFDTATINRELGYAESIGFNAMRVFLHHVAWQQMIAGTIHTKQAHSPLQKQVCIIQAG